MTNSDDHEPGLLKSRSGLVLIGFLAIAGFFLLMEHRAHVIAYLPYIFLLACPLMHLFHGGHGGHGGGSGDKGAGPSSSTGEPEPSSGRTQPPASGHHH